MEARVLWVHRIPILACLRLGLMSHESCGPKLVQLSMRCTAKSGKPQKGQGSQMVLTTTINPQCCDKRPLVVDLRAMAQPSTSGTSGVADVAQVPIVARPARSLPCRQCP
ncbi:hypothetical protein HaLaN_21168 [Haematococcus lacustris]|uniref:Secreted protein n=1 Tax=Haematococcus lacustris TaxID=44745 RepID=A0A6A0A2F0_HAELA|nr:hypothetical protein HaLaN_21168 [Haematococcus lacustris]